MLNDTLELNIAAKFYNKCQTDVNNHSNKCSGPNQMDRIIQGVFEVEPFLVTRGTTHYS
jgi:hypothetical protein